MKNLNIHMKDGQWMIGNKVEYIQAYTEINCLLRYFPKQYIKKLPNKLIELIDRNSNKKYEINIDYKLGLDKQNLSKKAYDLLSVLKYNYWSTEEEKEQIRQKLNQNEILFQKELSEKYNTVNLFKNKTKEIETIETKKENVAMVEYKESIFTILFNFIKNIFKH